MTVIIFCVLFVVAIIGCIFSYHVGEYNGSKKQADTTISVTNTMNSILEKFLVHSATQDQRVSKITEQKDFVINSLSKENTELRKALDDFNTLEEVLEEEEDEEEMEHAAVVATTMPAVIHQDFNQLKDNRTAAHVALDLHARVQAIKEAVKSLGKEGKIGEAQQTLLMSLTDIGKDSNVNSN